MKQYITGVMLTMFFSFFLLSGFASAQITDDFAALLGGLDLNFGYSDEIISAEFTTSTTMTITSPVVSDDEGNDIVDYMLMYGEYSIDAIVDSADFSLFDQLREKEFSGVTPSNGKVSFTLSTSSDAIDANKIHYVTVAPINSEGTWGEVSATELCFLFSEEIIGEGDDCAVAHGVSAGGAGNPGSVNMSLVNITHQLQGNNIRLIWSEIPDVDKVEIYLRDANGTSYSKLTTTNMNNEQYPFSSSRKSPLYIRFIGLDSNGDPIGNEVIYTIHDYLTSTPPPPPTKPGIPNVPQVGPANNALWAALFTVFVFLSVLFRRRGQKN